LIELSTVGYVYLILRTAIYGKDYYNIYDDGDNNENIPLCNIANINNYDWEHDDDNDDKNSKECC
jgi:hypothetical protein